MAANTIRGTANPGAPVPPKPIVFLLVVGALAFGVAVWTGPMLIDAMFGPKEVAEAAPEAP